MKTTTMMKSMMLVTMMSVSTMMFGKPNTTVNNKNDKDKGHHPETTIVQTGERGHGTAVNNNVNNHYNNTSAVNNNYNVNHNNHNNGSVNNHNNNHNNHATVNLNNHKHYNCHGWLNGKDIRGYEGLVRYNKGIWSYYRNGRWYHYNRYIDVHQYYSHKLSKWGKGIQVSWHY